MRLSRKVSNIIKINHLTNSKALITAHRGASAYAPENTLAAIELALRQHAGCIEIDVHLSRDKQVVVLHDDSLGRTTNGRGKVWKFNLDKLRHLDAGSWFSSQFSNEKIPLLEEILHSVRGKAKLNIEIKSHTKQIELVDRVVDVIEQAHFERGCIITSFDREVLNKVRNRNDNIAIGLISGVGIPLDIHLEHYDFLMCQAALTNKEIISHVHNFGKEIHVWTVNRIAAMRRFIRLGVDGIITNRPDILWNLLSTNNHQ